MSIPLFTVDAFASGLFTGNPAAVVPPIDTPLNDELKQKIAAEMNLSETAFVERRPDGDGFGLRWFTPAVEVDLCGHATLAAAHALWEIGLLSADQPVRFHTRSGLLVCRREGDRIAMDFPAIKSVPAPIAPEYGAALGAAPIHVARSRFDLLVELSSAQEVRRLNPDFSKIAPLNVRGWIVTACGDDPRYHCVSRFFAPRAGVNEDPVTGSAHCVLGPYWGAKLGLTRLTAYQASRRGGILGLELRGDRILLMGKAVTVLHAQLHL